jgi:hypothetical protein
VQQPINMRYGRYVASSVDPLVPTEEDDGDKGVDDGDEDAIFPRVFDTLSSLLRKRGLWCIVL